MAAPGADEYIHKLPIHRIFAAVLVLITGVGHICRWNRLGVESKKRSEEVHQLWDIQEHSRFDMFFLHDFFLSFFERPGVALNHENQAKPL